MKSDDFIEDWIREAKREESDRAAPVVAPPAAEPPEPLTEGSLERELRRSDDRLRRTLLGAAAVLTRCARSTGEPELNEQAKECIEVAKRFEHGDK